MFLPVLDGNVLEFGVLFFFRRREDQGRVGGRILRLVFGDGFEKRLDVANAGYSRPRWTLEAIEGWFTTYLQSHLE